MKKLMFVAAAALCGSVFADAITSANVVGYRTDGFTGTQLYMRGPAFTTVAGEDISIKTDVTFTNPKGGVEAAEADRVRIWDPVISGYITYFYYIEEDEGYVWHEENWLDEDEDPEIAAKYQGKIPAYQGYWYQQATGGESSKAMTVSGAVDQDEYDPFEITDGGLHMFANPYPVESRIKDETSVIIANPTGGVEAQYADKIRIWDPEISGYVTYFYYVEEDEGYVWHEENWLDEDEDPEIAAKYQGKIPAGQAFWYQTYLPSGTEPKANKSIKFVNPF